MAVPRLAWAVALVALLAPLAAAAGGHGTVQVAGSAQVPGDFSVDASHGDFVWNATHVPTLDVQGASFLVETWSTDTSNVKGPVGPSLLSQGNTPAPTSTSYGAGKLHLQPGADVQFLVLDVPDPSSVQLHDGVAQATRSALLVRGPQSASAPVSCLSTDPECLEVRGAYELAAASTHVDLAGPTARLFLHGPAAVIETADSTVQVATGEQDTQTAALTQSHDVWALVTIQQPTGTLDAGPAKWYVASPIVHAAEAVAARSTGDLSVGVRSYRATEEALDVKGTLTLVPGSVEADQPSYRPHYAPDFAMQIQGDVSSINLRATPVYAETTTAAGGLLGLAAVAAVVAYLWPRLSFHLTAAALPLYTRLKQPEILANEVRNTIYEIIRAHPGISAREVHRQSDQSWGTVVYHLRQLERHHLVVSRSVGRTRNYYENHGKYRGMEVQLACLQSARARTLAHLVNTTPGITQEDLATQSGFPQPTTSYYVRKLKAANLVEERRDGRYARYHPMPELTRFLQLADAAPAEPKVGFTDGVQA